MENARHGRALEDVTYALGCCLRAVACLCQVLFAVNRTYLLNEKGAVLGTQRLAFCPSDFTARVTCSLRAAGSGDTASAGEALNALVAETEALAASAVGRPSDPHGQVRQGRPSCNAAREVQILHTRPSRADR